VGALAAAAVKSRVSQACRVLAANGHGDFVWGHASARDPAGRGVWMKASGLGFEEVAADDVLLVDPDGGVLEGSGRRHLEYPIHTEVIAARPDVGGVVHSHPPHGVALAAAGRPLLPVSHAGTLFVPPEVPRFERTADLITTRELGREIAAELGGADALFLVNHGIVTVGPDVETATVRAILLERACAEQLLVETHGGAARSSSPDEARSKRSNIYSPEALRSVWDYLVRQLPD
jgi:L-ribulose-5-phosphate 4-epimerase